MEAIQHKDMLGRVVDIGDTVSYCQENCLYIGKVSKLTAKRVHVTRLTQGIPWVSQQLPETFIKLEDPAIVTWLLKGAKNKWHIMYGD